MADAAGVALGPDENAFVAGWSWAKIAEVLGVSRQAVHKKHAKRLIAAGVTLRRRQ